VFPLNTGPEKPVFAPKVPPLNTGPENPVLAPKVLPLKPEVALNEAPENVGPENPLCALNSCPENPEVALNEVPVNVGPENPDVSEIVCGRSCDIRARNEGALVPDVGPIKARFCATVAVPVPPDAVLNGVPRVNTSMEAPSTTVKAKLGLAPVCIATFPYPSTTMASCVWSQNSATLYTMFGNSFWLTYRAVEVP